MDLVKRKLASTLTVVVMKTDKTVSKHSTCGGTETASL